MIEVAVWSRNPPLEAHLDNRGQIALDNKLRLVRLAHKEEVVCRRTGNCYNRDRILLVESRRRIRKGEHQTKSADVNLTLVEDYLTCKTGKISVLIKYCKLNKIFPN